MLCAMLPIVLYRYHGLLIIFFYCWCMPHINHPQPTSNVGQKFFPVPKPFKEQLSRRRVNPPPQPPLPVQTPPPLHSNACLPPPPPLMPVMPHVGLH